MNGKPPSAALAPPVPADPAAAPTGPGSLRVLQLTPSVSRQAGGLLPIVQRVSQLLCERQARVSVVGLADAASELDRPGWSPLAPQVVPALPPRAFGYAPGLTPALDRADPELVHIHGIWMYPSWANLAWSVRTNRPYVVSPHGMLDPWALAHSRLKKRLVAALYENRHLRRAACLHALTSSEQNAIRDYGLRGPVALVPNGVDPAPPPSGRVPEWRRQIDADRKVLLFLGRLHPKKGLLPLLRSLQRAWQDGAAAARDWTLAIAGWDQNGHRAELEAFAREYDLADRVRFLGPQHGEEKTDSLHAADAFVLPSRSEGLPVAVLEAWAHGLPVAMTDACNLEVGFAAGAAHRVALTADDNLTGLVEFLELSADDRRRMGTAGRTLAGRDFDWRQIGDQYLALYRWLLGQAPRPDFVERGGS